MLIQDDTWKMYFIIMREWNVGFFLFIIIRYFLFWYVPIEFKVNPLNLGEKIFFIDSFLYLLKPLKFKNMTLLVTSKEESNVMICIIFIQVGIVD